VVWDVDPLAESVHIYRADDPNNPVTYRQGDVAEAEPALPGWRVPISDVFA
jgi:Uma2 family endonuclease